MLRSGELQCGEPSAECEVKTNKEKPPDSSRSFVPHSAFRTPHSKGFTLLEVMVAVAILAMVLVTLIGLQNRSAQDVILAEHMTTATLLAKRMMTEALVSGTKTPAEHEGEFEEEEFKEYTWKKMVAQIPVPETSVMITEIRVAVLWKEGTRDESVELVSYE
jgi:general secretion pathway protein I